MLSWCKLMQLHPTVRCLGWVVYDGLIHRPGGWCWLGRGVLSQKAYFCSMGASHPQGGFFLRQQKFQESEQERELQNLAMPGLRAPTMSFVLHSTTGHRRSHSQSRLTGVEKWSPPLEQSCGEVML